MDYSGNVRTLVDGQFHDKLFVTIDLKFHCFHVIMWIVICIGLVVEICHCRSFVKINLTLKRKVFCQILCDKSHHTQIEYTKELSINRILLMLNTLHTLCYTHHSSLFHSLLISSHLFAISLHFLLNNYITSFLLDALHA